MTQEEKDRYDKAIRSAFHGFSDEQWEEKRNTFPYNEMPHIIHRVVVDRIQFWFGRGVLAGRTNRVGELMYKNKK